MEQQTGSKLGKEYIKAVYYHLAYLTYMQSTSCKMPGWIKYSRKRVKGGWEERRQEGGKGKDKEGTKEDRKKG